MATRILTEEDKRELEEQLGIGSETFSTGKAIRLLTEEDKVELEEKIAQAGPKIELEKLTVTPKESTQYFLPKEGSAYSAVTVEKIPGKYQDVSGITTKPEQVLDGCYFMDSSGEMMEGEIPTRSAADLSVSGLTVSVPAGYYETDAYKSVDIPDTGDSDITLVTTRVTSTKGTQEVTPNIGEAFSKVIVNPIPDKYQDVSGVTAGEAQVLDGYRFVDSTGELKEGQIPFRSAEDLIASNTTVTVPAGYYESEITKEVDLDILEGAGISFASDDVKLTRTNSNIWASATMTREMLLPAGTTIEFQMSGSRFGNAARTDVAFGATFTSENGLNIPGTRPVDEGSGTAVKGTAEADSLAQLHYWKKSAVTEAVDEESVTDYWLYNQFSYGTGSVTYGLSQYAQEIEIVDGSLVLVNPQERGAYDTFRETLPGKYIQSGSTIYRIPVDAVITTSQGSGYYRVTVDRAFKLSCVTEGSVSIVVTDDSTAYPENGELDGYTYVYQGTLSDTEKAAVIQALTITENGTYTVPAGVDGYSPVTVNVDQGVQLPSIDADVLGTASDLAEGKQLIGADGSVVTGMVEACTDYSQPCSPEQVGDLLFMSKKLTKPILVRGGYIDLQTSLSNFGDAEPGDVRAGKTFTSKKGLKIPGELEVGVQLPSIDADVLGTASDLAAGKQLIGPDGTAVTGTVPVETVEFYMDNDGIDNNSDLWSPYFFSPKDVLVRKDTKITVDIAKDDCGDATPQDVRAGKTFISKEGWCIHGNAVFPGEQYHWWTKFLDDSKIVETEKSSVVLSSHAPLSGDYYDYVQYADDVEIVDGGISLVEGQRLYIDGTEDISTILGKYIYSERNAEFYIIPSDAKVSSSGTQSKSISVSPAFLLSVECLRGDFLEDVFAEDAATYPENGTKDGYWYIYQGLHEETEPEITMNNGILSIR